ncbi:phytanoyl-CoA dioxygenase family protein [Candidatus Poribacteria bacterium]|nr:phytanoyl-CoA dioxygenase family protein [Candidatus Poribacteria bacterium]
MLTNQEIQQFHEEGYLIFESLICGEKLKSYVAIFDELVERSREVSIGTPHWSFELDDDHQQIAGFLHKIQGVCVVEPRILSLAKEPEILARIEALIGKNIDVFGTKFFPKLPNGGTSVNWHQDNFYFGTNTSQIVSCGIYLQDADAENGCLRIVPKSHTAQVIAEHHRNAKTYGSWTVVDDSEAVDVSVLAGSVVLFSANLLHGSYDNRSTRSRYSTAWHYTPAELALERFPRGGYKDRHIVCRHEES